jgi:NDP-sugar pyrophosphorylase family protein
MDVGRPKELFGANITAAEKLFSEKEQPGRIEMSAVTGPFYIGPLAKITDSEISSSVISKGSSVISSKVSRSLIMADCDISGAFISESIIGEGCVIAEGCVITDSVLADGTVVKKNERIEKRTGG